MRITESRKYDSLLLLNSYPKLIVNMKQRIISKNHSHRGLIHVKQKSNVFIMKRFLVYLLKSYCWTVIVITLAVLLEATIRYYFDSSYEKTPFSSPLFAAIAAGVFYPICNLIVIIVLYRHEFTKLEVAVESICLINIIAFIGDVIDFLVPQSLLWTHKTVDGINVLERVWWYKHSMHIVYGVCVTIILCLLYIKVKKLVIKYKK